MILTGGLTTIYKWSGEKISSAPVASSTLLPWLYSNSASRNLAMVCSGVYLLPLTCFACFSTNLLIFPGEISVGQVILLITHFKPFHYYKR
jgi:hypothetical protein